MLTSAMHSDGTQMEVSKRLATRVSARLPQRVGELKRQRVEQQHRAARNAYACLQMLAKGMHSAACSMQLHAGRPLWCVSSHAVHCSTCRTTVHGCCPMRELHRAGLVTCAACTTRCIYTLHPASIRHGDLQNRACSLICWRPCVHHACT